MQSQTAGFKAQSGEDEQAPESKSNRRQVVLAVGLSVLFVLAGRILLAVVTGLPLIPPFLHSFDSINFALALENFDPTRNQPQPPGYPFFVIEARLLNLVFFKPEHTFAAIQILISGLSVAVLYLLARKMMGARAGFIATALLAVNPVFWYAVLGSPLRPHLAFVSVTVAYFCWRALEGDPKYFYAASVAFGMGSGFRPELAAILFPLWAWTAWNCRGRGVRITRGVLLLILTTASWILVLASVSGGLRSMFAAFANYGSTQMQETAVLLNPASGSWRRWAGRAVIWNALGVVPWIWTVPMLWRRRRELALSRQWMAFLSLWFVPGFLFQFAVHIGEPDHALSTVPALCVAGAFVVTAAELFAGRWAMPSIGNQNISVVLWIALCGNLLLFFGAFPVPHRTSAVAGFRGLQSLTDAVLIGTYEASYSRVRWIDQMAELAIDRIRELTPSDRPMIIAWARDGEPGWRKVAYYLPSAEVYSFDEKGDPASPVGLAQLWKRGHRQEAYFGPVPIKVPVPMNARIIWLISPAAVADLGGVFPLSSAPPVYYTDLPEVPSTFRWGSFEFVPRELSEPQP